MSFKHICVLLFVIWLVWAYKLWFQNRDDMYIAKVVFCDVGQGDAALVVLDNFQLLVDGGPDDSVLACLQREMPIGDHELEWVVLSHPDADHFYGLISVLQQYSVDRLWTYNVGKASSDYRNFYEQVWRQLNAGNLVVENPFFGEKFCPISRICVEVVSDFREMLPSNIFESYQTFENLSDMFKKFIPSSFDFNNGSIVFILYIDQFSFIFTGDAELPEELALINLGLLTDIDVLKTGHHGSKSSSSRNFLDLVRPEISVISCGKNNSYGHPHMSTLETLSIYSDYILRTDQMGTIKFMEDSDFSWHWSGESTTSPD